MNKQTFIDRRKRLIEIIKQQHPDKKGPVFLWANFEKDAIPFRQESTFYYFTGIKEPAVALCIDDDGKTSLFVPNTQGCRKQWVPGSFEVVIEDCVRAGVDEIIYFGEPVVGFSLSPLFNESAYKIMIQRLKDSLDTFGALFTCYPSVGFYYTQQVALLNRLQQFIPALSDSIIDISTIVAAMRRCKYKGEIEQIFKRSLKQYGRRLMRLFR